MKKYRSPILHLICWLSLPFVVTFFRWIFQLTSFPIGSHKRIASYFQVWSDNVELNLAIMLIGASVFYITFLMVFPVLFAQPIKKTVKIVIYALLLLILPYLILVLMSVFSLDIALVFRYFLFFGYLVQIPFVLAGVAAGYLKKWLHSKQALALMEKQAIRAELQLLKSQINPHFLFNTINNIDTLIIKDPPLASQYLNGLAGLLRFMLYKVKTDRISLAKEMSFIENYVELQKIRSVNPNFINLTVKGMVENQQIAPLLFIPLVENAFKHVADKLSDNSINVDFEITPAWVLFTCNNSYKEKSSEHANEDGLGLEIMGQRLALIYPDRHSLQINKGPGRYEVSLKLFFDAN